MCIHNDLKTLLMLTMSAKFINPNLKQTKFYETSGIK